MDIAHAVGMAPVHVIHLDLDKVPVVFPVQGQEFVQRLLVAMERESQLADGPFLPLLEQEIHHPVFNITHLESAISATADGMQEVVVDIIRLQLLERVAVHPQGSFARGVLEIGQLGGPEEILSRMPVEGDGGSPLRLTAQVSGRSVEVIDTVVDRIIHQLVHFFLVDNVFPVGTGFLRPAHAAVAQQGNLVSVARIDAVFHLTGRRAVGRIPGSDGRFGLTAGQGGRPQGGA